jgi:hypothetical protein
VCLFFLACMVPGAVPRNIIQVGMTSQPRWV